VKGYQESSKKLPTFLPWRGGGAVFVNDCLRERESAVIKLNIKTQEKKHLKKQSAERNRGSLISFFLYKILTTKSLL